MKFKLLKSFSSDIFYCLEITIMYLPLPVDETWIQLCETSKHSKSWKLLMSLKRFSFEQSTIDRPKQNHLYHTNTIVYVIKQNLWPNTESFMNLKCMNLFEQDFNQIRKMNLVLFGKWMLNFTFQYFPDINHCLEISVA